MSANSEPASTPSLPLILLKTKSQPRDAYEDHFAGVSHEDTDTGRSYRFGLRFIPVLEHKQNANAIAVLAKRLQDGELKYHYGGMIFTSQRAVEAWFDVVKLVEQQSRLTETPKSSATDPFCDLQLLKPFPLYVVGPATERALQILLDESHQVPNSAFSRLNPSIHGAQSGNGANLAPFILSHYNQLHREHWFNYFEAPRLPFIPLLGMSSQNYGRRRLDPDDPRLQKKPLCFLVGETRRDVIPKTLQAAKDAIKVDEIEVYATEVVSAFGQDFGSLCASLEKDHSNMPRVVVVFSPQGSDTMLKELGYLDGDGSLTDIARQRWYHPGRSGSSDRWVVATIGPTTRDYLRKTYGFEADICAEKPSPEGLLAGIKIFLEQNSLDS